MCKAQKIQQDGFSNSRGGLNLVWYQVHAACRWPGLLQVDIEYDGTKLRADATERDQAKRGSQEMSGTRHHRTRSLVCVLVQVAIAFGTGEVQGEFVSEAQTMPVRTRRQGFFQHQMLAGRLPQL